jgi:hypothetical protein
METQSNETLTHILFEPGKPAKLLSRNLMQSSSWACSLGTLVYVIENHQWIKRSMVRPDKGNPTPAWVPWRDDHVTKNQKLQVLLLTT